MGETEKKKDLRANRMRARRRSVKDKNITWNWKMKYDIYGYRYTFEKIYLDEQGIPYGYCSKKKIWAWLYIDAISRYGADIELIPAKRLESKICYSNGEVSSGRINEEGNVVMEE